MALVISGHTCADAGLNRATLLHHFLGRYPSPESEVRPWGGSPSLAGHGPGHDESVLGG